MHLDTPYYLIDEGRMLTAMEKIRRVQRGTNAKCVLALKCFSSWCAFDFMKEYLVGTTSSSLYEARLGHEKFGGENHGYSVAYDEAEILEIARYCNKVIFNSLSQLQRYHGHVGGASIGLRLNPEVGYSEHALSDPVARYSRLGVKAEQLPTDIASRIEGAMIHVNCDNEDFSSFCAQLERIESSFGPLLGKLKWLSLGGGVAFTAEGYPLEDFCLRLAELASRYSLQLYLEPGEAAVVGSTSLVVQVLDIVHNEVPTLIVDAGVEPHLPDVLTYQFTPELEGAIALAREDGALAERPGHVYRVCGRTCLSGDHFGNYAFERPMRIGERLCFTNVGGYSMVKKSFFNGIKMPSVYHKRRNGHVRLAHQPSYEDFRDALSS